MKNKIKIAFQGENGAYSHLACLEMFPNSEPLACPTFEAAFQLGSEDQEYKIVIPIENSLAGRVADIHYLIPKYGLQIHAEHFQKVTHNLLGVKGSKLEDIKTVRSHAQAISQFSGIAASVVYQAGDVLSFNSTGIDNTSANWQIGNSVEDLAFLPLGPTTPNWQRRQAWHQFGLGSSHFARRYSGSRCCFLFLGLLRCFSSPSSLYPPYVFRRE